MPNLLTGIGSASHPKVIGNPLHFHSGICQIVAAMATFLTSLPGKSHWPFGSVLRTDPSDATGTDQSS